jgi:hypothetical protein
MNDSSATPILDLIEPFPPRRSLRRPSVGILVTGGLVLVAAVVIKFVFSVSILDQCFSALNRFSRLIDSHGAVVFVLLALAALSAALVIHELGHLFVGWVVGFHLQQLLVGPLLITVRNGKTGFRLLNRGLNGLTKMGIKEPVGSLQLPGKLACFIAAGPGANIFCGAAVALVFSDWYGRNSFQLSVAIGDLFVFFSFLLATTNLVPAQLRCGRPTDGARLLSLAAANAESRRWISTLVLDALAECGVRPKKWDQLLVERASSCPDGSQDARYGNWLAYRWASDRNDEEAAASYLECCLRNVYIPLDEFCWIIVLEASIFQAWFRGDAAKASEWYAKVGDSIEIPPILKLRAMIALLWAQGKTGDAIRVWQRALVAIRSWPRSPVQSDLEQSWLEWRQEMGTRRP